jgi:hypothetical protein
MTDGDWLELDQLFKVDRRRKYWDCWAEKVGAEIIV